MADAQLVSQSRIYSLRPLLLLVGIAVAVAAGVATMLWWQGPNWDLLYGNLSGTDAAQVTQSLQAAGIRYKLNDASGAIMVPADKVSQARMQLASQGLPGSAGIDLISKETGIGVSQFMETARYQYALEQELARTIGSLRNVEAARVRLAIPQQSAFVRDRRAATASVLVQIKQGARLEDGQVQAIVHLVASSMPELDSKQVTIVDQQGRLLSSPDGGSDVAGEQLAAAQRLEQSYVQRVEQLLVPLVGVGRVRAQVAVDLDAAVMEQTHEQYAPNSGVVRSEQTSEATSKSGAGAAAGGVPGSLTNQPPAGGTVANAAPAGAAGTAAKAAAANTAATAAGAAGAAAAPGTVAAPDSVSKQATRSYEIERTLSYNRQPGGRVKRVSVAVLLDNVHKVGADGKETTEALPAAQIEDITRLVKNAVGFDEARGDSVGVVNAAFREDHQTLTPEATPLWQKPWVQDVARLALGALVLLALALGVLRPLIRNLTAHVIAPAGTGAAALAGPGGALSADGGAAGALAAQRPMQLEQQIADAKSALAQDPKRAAQVVKTWVGDR